MSVRVSLLRMAFVVGGLATSLGAGSAGAGASAVNPDWILAEAVASPPARYFHSMAYDSARGRVVLFGGLMARTGQLRLADTWEWDGSTWVERTPAERPPARTGHAMAYDSARGRVVLFGGDGSSSDLADTWEWDGSSWTRASPGTAPPSRHGHAMAYDSARGRVVLFGGWDGFSAVLADTWEWDGSTWIQRTPPQSPPPRAYHAMAYDSARERVVLHGGSELGDTWEWDGSTWVERTPAQGAPDLSYHAMAHDSARGCVVLFGGVGPSGVLGGTWEWDGSAWVERTPATTPHYRGGHAMAYDSARGRVVVYGGALSYDYFDDTWEWDGTSWVDRTPPTSPSARDGHAMVYDGARGRVVLFGGYRDFDDSNRVLADTWEWDGSTWVERRPTTSPSPREDHALAYDSARERVVLFGGWGGFSAVLADTWEWDGGTWVERTPATSPAARSGHAMAYDSARGRVVLFGGWDYYGNGFTDTWEWDGSTWVERTPAASPPGPGMAVYDSARERVVLLQGTDTWEWDGSAWVERTPPVRTPGLPLYHSGMAHDSARARAVLLLGSYDGTLHGATWEWDGLTWAEQTTATSLPARVSSAMAYDSARERVVLFGGYSEPPGERGDTWEYGLIDACGHASSVVAHAPGSGTDDASAFDALRAADGVAVSLGLDGSFVLRLDPPVLNGPGADLIVHETGSRAGGVDENYRVEVSEAGVAYRFLRDCPGGDCQLDLAEPGLALVTLVRITDLPPSEAEAAPASGADIDAVSVVFAHCDTAEICNGLDEGDDGYIPPDEIDHDGDGYVECSPWVGSDPEILGGGDCAPVDPAISPAAEVSGLAVESLGAGALRLSWEPAAGAASYAIVRGDLSALSANHLGECRVGGWTALEWDDGELPPAGTGFSYIVRGESPACGPGTLGFGAYGMERDDTGSACPE